MVSGKVLVTGNMLFQAEFNPVQPGKDALLEKLANFDCYNIISLHLMDWLMMLLIY